MKKIKSKRKLAKNLTHNITNAYGSLVVPMSQNFYDMVFYIYWNMGRQIVAMEEANGVGEHKSYKVLKRVAKQLVKTYGNGCSKRDMLYSLETMRQVYLDYNKLLDSTIKMDFLGGAKARKYRKIAISLGVVAGILLVVVAALLFKFDVFKAWF